jgi:TorA maturation chaperone TorD
VSRDIGRDPIDQARAQEYALLAALLSRSPDAALIGRLAQLRGDATPLGTAHTALATAAARLDAATVAREFFELFVGLGRGELLPYASYYLTGFLHGRPLASLRQTLQRIGIARADTQTEPEDHVAVLFEVMAGLADGTITAMGGTERDLFERHLAPWIARFFADLERATAADFYARVGALGRIFMAIETEAFRLPD